MRPIKTALLCIPMDDEDAVTAVRLLLRRAVPNAVVLVDRHIASQRYLVEEVLRRWCDEDELDLILTLGATMPAPGPGAQEIAPEATSAVIERAMPGLSEAMRAYACEESALALLDRGVAGIRGRTLVVNLPAGLAAALFLEAIVDAIAPTIAHLHEETDAPVLSAVLATGNMADSTGAKDRSEAAPPARGEEQRRGGKPLDADEFAAFLRRQTPDV